MDAERRAAERAAKADPQDPAAARALAEALRRSGDRRGLFHALCALGRAGDAEARAEVEAWSPWPGPDGQGNRRAARGRPLRDPQAPRVARHPVGLVRSIAGVTGAHLVVVCVVPAETRAGMREVLVAVDLATLAVAWTVPTEEVRGHWDRGPATLAGEDVVWATTGDRLRVVRAADGEVRAELALGLPARADQHLAAADGDVVAVGAVEEPSVQVPGGSQCLVVVDLASDRVRWRSTRLTTPALVAAFDGQAVYADGRTASLADGARTGPPRLEGGAWRVARLEGGATVTIVREGGVRSAVRLDPGADRPRWSVDLGGESTSDDLVVVGTTLAVVGYSRLADEPVVVALDVESGAVRWRQPLPSTGSLDVPVVSLAGVGPDVAILVAAGQGTRLLGIDAASGTLAFELALEDALLVRPSLFGMPARVDFAELVALDGALLVVASGGDGELVVARIAGG